MTQASPEGDSTHRSGVAARRIDTIGLLALAGGNFIYIGASDLVPEVNKHREMRANVVHFAAFVAGVALLAAIRVVRPPLAGRDGTRTPSHDLAP